MRTYDELSSIPDFLGRYEYLRIGSHLGDPTFGSRRYLNQAFYASPKWRHARAKAIYRDEGCDLGILDREVDDKIIVHHMNPITREQVERDDPALYDLNNLISCALMTHNAIHYGDKDLLVLPPDPRCPNDTIPWR